MRPSALLVQGNALDVSPGLEPADVIVTSPPYFAARDYEVDGQWGVEHDPQSFVDNMVALFRCLRTTKDAVAFVVINDTRVSNFHNARKSAFWSSKGGEKLLTGPGAYPPNTMKRNSWKVPLSALLAVPWRLGLALAPEWHLKAEVIWDKGVGRAHNTHAPARAHETVLVMAKQPRRKVGGQSIVRVPPDGSGTSHPAPYPPDLVRKLLDMVETDGPVLDPFCGSGTTGVICAERGLPFIGVDLKLDYLNEASMRINRVCAADYQVTVKSA